MSQGNAEANTNPDEETTMCAVCENPCDATVPITEQSVQVEEYTWICYDPESETDTAFLHA